MTYDDLAKIIQGMSEDQRAAKVTIFSREKQIKYKVDPVYGYCVEYCDSTGLNQPIIVINDK